MVSTCLTAHKGGGELAFGRGGKEWRACIIRVKDSPARGSTLESPITQAAAQ